MVLCSWTIITICSWLNRRHGRSGHLFQGRFKSVAVSRDEWALALSRYVHLNPVRTKTLGLDKGERQAQHEGLSAAPEAKEVRERIRRLRAYRWSSSRAYIGLGKVPSWLEGQTVLGLGGGAKAEQRRRYREYVESAVREGLEESPWEAVREQVVLGGAEFLAGLREHVHGDAQEQRGARRLAGARPTLEAVIAAVERVKGEKWDEFRERHADRGRDLVLYLGRRLCRLKLRELAEAVGLRTYAVVATNTKRYEQRLPSDSQEQARVKKVSQLLNCEM